MEFLLSQSLHVRSGRRAAQGYNAAIIAYGQTGTGKTYTMEGDRRGPGRGIIPRAIEDVFATIAAEMSPHSKFLVRASYVEIYNEARPCLPHLLPLVLRQALLCQGYTGRRLPPLPPAPPPAAAPAEWCTPGHENTPAHATSGTSARYKAV